MAHDDPLKKLSFDVTDPFRYEGNFAPVQTNGIKIPFETIDKGRLIRIRRLGDRASALLVGLRESGVEIMPPHPAVASADFAVVELRRGLNLELLESMGAHDFLEQYVTIARHIDRPRGEFSSLVPLRCAVH